MPEGSDADTLQRLSRLIAQTSAQNLVILGDVFHTRYAAMEPVLHRIAAWRAQHPAVRISIVPGNHDRCVPWSDWLPGAAILEAGTKLGAFRVMHHPALLEAEPVLCGHLHPGCAIGTRRMEKRTVPCFWLRDQTLVLPAFGAFTGLAKVRIGSVGKVFVPCGEKVIELTPAKVAPAPVKR